MKKLCECRKIFENKTREISGISGYYFGFKKEIPL
jgi:hypothetical protein